MATAMIGYNSTYVITDPPSTLVTLLEVFNITPPSFTADRVEVTHMKSPNRTREYVPGMISPGSASFQLNFVPGNTSDVLIRTHQAAGTVTTHKIVFPNNVSWSFQGAIESYEPDAPTDDRMTATVNVSVSGTITQGVG